jgi:hypothetical protein
MKTYVVTTGIVFALILLAHLARVVMEGIQVATQPAFVFTTALAAGLCIWAWRLVRSAARSP